MTLARAATLAALLGSASASAQTVDGGASGRPPLSAYARPERLDGPSARPVAPREVPAAERAQAAPRVRYAFGYSSPRVGLGLLAGLAVAGLGAVVTARVTRGAAEPTPTALPPMRSRPPVAAAPGGVEVRRVTVALDAAGAIEVFRALAAGAPTLHARATLLRDAIVRSHGALRAGAFASWSGDEARGAEAFRQMSDAMRSRRAPRRGAGFAVVTLVVAVKGTLPPLAQLPTLASVLAALESLVPARADRLVSLDVIGPEDPSDTVAKVDVVELLPDLLFFDA